MSGADPRDKQAYLNATPAQREVVFQGLRQVLGILRAMYLSYQTSHWQVKGRASYGNHLLFQRLYEGVTGQIDDLAEKMVGYLDIEAVDLSSQLGVLSRYVARWDSVDDLSRRGLLSEEDLQTAIKSTYDSIKAASAMTLGLDDWLMATANAHETNSYLLQQSLDIGSKMAAMTEFLVSVRLIDRKGQIVSKNVKVRARNEAEAQQKVSAKYTQKGNLYEVDFARPLMAAEAVAPSAEGAFNLPESHEVREFADSGAISNSTEVAAEASGEDHLDLPKAVAVAEAEAGPPTPDEIEDEPGGEELSTLNRFQVASVTLESWGREVRAGVAPGEA